ncbi:FGGY-family carbohydrate kinase [Agrobacterium rubi]|uniref:Carbohydrate kinase n=1 Tax=Agrobacterium rubi TaxID=28099 RepID=A0AAE7R5I0_9HYPH|nr:FGGY-family carbohydrate kinase [Agrobacterium rubi]NTE85289.1 carbohydrate kinase [Agrobacterium rubi]NTF01221.1 carbohydrate kinase [Agrobacterium rubi]NTF35409.1 carbohydrate kinase [Agrobacterium rubi]OCJ48586.1 carbohydrate kinase [Agrobacterium rubi]QTG00598.1 carbohydrate kinase [Agrobacterium rubi]
MSTAIRNVAVIDIGKTHAKLIVVDGETGEEIASRKIANRVLSGPPYPHYDIEALWGFILDGLCAFREAPGYQAISITTHGASAALLNGQGDLALPILDYEHSYPDDVQKTYAALRPPFEETFSPALPIGLNLGAQLHYQKTAFPKAFAEVTDILTYPQYWAYRLTGVKANEATSLGCHTDLWQPGKAAFSSLPETLGITNLLAPVRSAFDVLGTVLPDIAAKIGIDGEIPVYCGLHDSNASLLPHLMVREGPFSVVSTGTWVICFGVGAPLETLDPTRDTLVNVDAFGKPVPSARFMGGREFEMLTAGASPVENSALKAALEKVLADDILYLPNAVEGSGPFPGLKGYWHNEPRNDAERLVAASLYAAIMTASCLELIGNSGTIIVEGPFSANRHFTAGLAAITGADVLVTDGNSPSGTALGAALLVTRHAPRQSYHTVEPLVGMDHYYRTWRDLTNAAYAMA